MNENTPYDFYSISQIPAGSIPIFNSRNTFNNIITLPPFTTIRKDYLFYFPYPGNFTQYSTNVFDIHGDTLKGHANTQNILKVIHELDNLPVSDEEENWDVVSSLGTSSQVIKHLSSHLDFLLFRFGSSAI